jgi:hypothetical protein
LKKSILNLPYTDSEDEEHQTETGHEDSVTTGHKNSVYVDVFTARYEDLPSPTPQEEQEPQVADASSSKRVITNGLGKIASRTKVPHTLYKGTHE